MPRNPVGAGRAAAYTQLEIDKLLDLIEDVLPCGADQWERVGTAFRNHFIGAPKPRDTDSLKLKFKTLRLHKKPTGDPLCPPDVKRAKRIYRQIEINSDVIGDEDEDGDHLEDYDGDHPDDGGLDDDDDDDNDGAVDAVANAPAASIAAPTASIAAARTASIAAAPTASIAAAPTASIAAAPTPRRTTPVTSAPVRSASTTPSTTGRPSSANSASAFRTTLRTGYSEEQLIAANASGRIPPTTSMPPTTTGMPPTTKRNLLDQQIALTSAATTGDSFLHLFMIQQASQDARREEAEARRDQERRDAEERRENERRDAEERREKERREDRLDREQQRRDDKNQQMMFMASLLGKRIHHDE